MARRFSRISTRVPYQGRAAVSLAGVGILLNLLFACVDQPLIALERANTGGSGGNLTGNSLGGVGTGLDGSVGHLGGTTSAGGSAPGNECSGLSQPCDESKNDCCDGFVCVNGMGNGTGNGTCVLPVCSGADDVCASNFDCCLSMTCNPQRGCVQSVLCNQPNITCISDKDCCSGLCRADPMNVGGSAICQLVSGCSPIGTGCDTSADCCSGDCVRFYCSAQTRCLVAGETHCDEDGVSCCLGLTCRADTQGVHRCVVTTCVGVGQSCSSDGDCCSSTNSVTCVSGDQGRVCTLV